MPLPSIEIGGPFSIRKALDSNHESRWFSSGRGGARTMSFLLSYLARSIAPDAIPQLARNAQPTPSPCRNPAHQDRSHPKGASLSYTHRRVAPPPRTILPAV